MGRTRTDQATREQDQRLVEWESRGEETEVAGKVESSSPKHKLELWQRSHEME